MWSVIQDEVPYLSQPFLDIRMRYKEKVLGSKGLRKRWKTCVSYTNEYLGEILGKLYKDKNFKESAKITVSIIVIRSKICCCCFFVCVFIVIYNDTVFNTRYMLFSKH